VLQCVAVCCSVLCCSVLQCVAVCCSVLQCVAVCCSVLLTSIRLLYTLTLARYTLMMWQRLLGSLKLQVSFAQYSLFYRALLQKETHKLRSLQIVATPYSQGRVSVRTFCIRSLLRGVDSLKT